MSLLFFVIFVVYRYEIWCVVFHGMLMLRLEVGGGALLPGFSLLV
jgi:hypothetical protein